MLLPGYGKKSDMFSNGIILFTFSGRNSTQRKRRLPPVSCIPVIATNGVCYSVRDDSISKLVMQVVVQKSSNKLHFHRCMLCWARFRIIPITLTGFSAWDLQTVREHCRTMTETPIVEMDGTGKKTARSIWDISKTSWCKNITLVISMNVFRFSRQTTSTLTLPPAGIAGNRSSTCSRHFCFCTQIPQHPWFKIDYGNWQRTQLQNTPARSILMKRWPGVSCGDAAPVAMSQISVKLSTSGKTLCVKKVPQTPLSSFLPISPNCMGKEANFFAIIHFF